MGEVMLAALEWGWSECQASDRWQAEEVEHRALLVMSSV